MFLELYDEVMLLQKMSGGYTVMDVALCEELLVRKWVADPAATLLRYDEPGRERAAEEDHQADDYPGRL